MKYLLLFLLSPLFSTSQDSVNNFVLNNSEIIWQRDFPTTLTFNQLSRAVKESGLIDNVSIEDSTITGRTTKMRVDHKGAGYSAMSTPGYLLGNDVQAFAVIRFEGDHYNVRLKQINTLQGSKIVAGIFSAEAGDSQPLEFFAANNKRTKLRTSFKTDGSTVINYNLKKRFAF